MDSDFRRRMRDSESSGRYGILTTITEDGDQVAGAYQFSEPRLEDYRRATGEDFTQEDFAADPALQERVMDWHEQNIADYIMSNELDQFIGQNIGGVDIDLSALTGMAHLGGREGMRDFLMSGGEYNPADKFGTTLQDYGRKFSGLNMFAVSPTRPKARPDGLLGRFVTRPRARPAGLLTQ